MARNSSNNGNLIRLITIVTSVVYTERQSHYVSMTTAKQIWLFPFLSVGLELTPNQSRDNRFALCHMYLLFVIVPLCQPKCLAAYVNMCERAHPNVRTLMPLC
ncbi:hypothetical protein BLOT_007180 [Blomia tropicalis]|nr:hypothetical protein BLOT_007180 [Blomia tropicalis]